MEILRYVTASPIPTQSHIYESHSNGVRKHQAVHAKLNNLEKYLSRLEKLSVKARRTDNTKTLLAICCKVGKISRKLHFIHLHGRVKRHVHKKIQRIQEEVSMLLRDALEIRESEVSLNLIRENGTSKFTTGPGSSDTEFKYHITLEEIPDEDGI